MNRRELLTGAALLAGAGQANAFGIGGMGRRLGRGGLLGGASSPAYVPQGVAFEGDTYAKRAGLVGAANSRFGSLSFWLDMTSSDGVVNEIVTDFSRRFELFRDTSNRVSINLTTGVQTFTFRTTSTIVAADGWAHFCASWDTNQAAGSKIAQLYKNGASDLSILSDVSVAFIANYTVNEFDLGALSAGSNQLAGLVKELMFWPGVQIDWSNPANLAKVYRSGNPVDPGPTGALVTGTAPIMYLTIKPTDTLATTFLTNKGTGGDFATTAGALVLEKRPIIGFGDSHIFGTGASIITLDLMAKLCRGLSPPWRQLDFGVGGETSTAIKNRMVAAVAAQVAAYPNAIWILEGGYNNQTSPATVISDHTAMVNALLAVQPSAKYVGMSVWNGNTAAQRFGGADYANFPAIETGLKSLYGTRYADVWRYFVKKSVSTTTSQAFIDSGLTPTAQDLTDLNDDIVPASFRGADVIHLNDAGHNGAGTFVLKPLIQSLGWG